MSKIETVPLEYRARQALWIIDNNPPSTIAAMQEFAPKTWARMEADLRAFEAANR